MAVNIYIYIYILRVQMNTNSEPATNTWAPQGRQETTQDNNQRGPWRPFQGQGVRLGNS